MNISNISIKRPTVPIVLLIVTILAGVFLGTKLKYELIPDISSSTIVVTTAYPGASARDIEKSVTIPVEDALARMEGIDEMLSSSMEGVSMVRIMMNMDVDGDKALQDAKAKIDQIKRTLPKDIYEPSVSSVDLSALPIITIGATSNLSNTDFYDLIDKTIQPALSQIPGVANVNIVGGTQKEIEVNINKTKLEAFDLTMKQVVQMVGASNVEFPAGKIEDATGQLKIRLVGRYKSLSQLQNTVVGYSNKGDAIYLDEIADVFEGTKDVKTIAKINGVEAIGLEISKQKDANAVDVSRLVHEELNKLETSSASSGLHFIVSNDNSVFTLSAAKAVGGDLIMAIVLVSLIMLLFLKSYRNTIFVLVTIPTSLIATFIVMYVLNFSLDLISLTSLSLVVGSVVDDAIVVIENIHRHMEMGKTRLQATKDSMSEIGITLVSTTAVLAAVFIPISFVTGITGQILHEYAIIIVAAMLFSLLFTFTLVPLLTSRFAKIEIPKENFVSRILDNFERFLDKVARWITRLLNWTLHHKLITTGAILVAFAASIWLIPAGFIGTSFIDAGDRGNAIIRIELPRSTTIHENLKVSSQVEKIILSQPEVENLYTTVGKRTGGFASGDNETPYYTEFNVIFVPSDKRDKSSENLARILRYKIEEKIPGIKVSAANVNIMGNEDIPIKIYVKGNDLDSIYKGSEEVCDMLKSIHGTTEVENSLNFGSPEYQVHFDRDKMAYYGLTIGGVSKDIQMAFAGNTDNKYRIGDNEYDINVRYDQFDRQKKSDLESLRFNTNRGIVTLSQFATIVQGQGPSVLERYARSSSATVTCQLVGVSQGQAQAQFEQLVKEKGLPDGVTFDYSKMSKMMNESFASLAVAFIAAILFMYLIMVLLYNNWLHPFVVLFTIPLAIIGALFALALANQNLSMFTALGIIMLAGLVAKNAILVIDFANDLLTQGKELVEAITEAVLLRFRAILMTNISMIIGLIPLAVSSGAGSEWKSGIGWVLIGGLTVSMFLSMIIVPMIYYVVEKLKMKFTK
jgi:HAE1 family hydrophobic/amphiphilic exporter-1